MKVIIRAQEPQRAGILQEGRPRADAREGGEGQAFVVHPDARRQVVNQGNHVAAEQDLLRPVHDIIHVVGCLVGQARDLSRSLDQPTQTEAAHPALALPGATFVTLTQNGELRGCIGSLEAHRPLDKDVRANAVAAAFSDPRFPPLTLAELPHTRVEVSLLTAPTPMSFNSEEDALRQLRPNVDGIILIAGHRRSTFLPQVWEQLPAPRQFLAHLKQKAGLPPDWWSTEVQLQRYEVQKWKEASPR